MGVIAKFRVNSIKQFVVPTVDSRGPIEVELNAVYPSDEDDKVTRDENTKFFEATPSAYLKMTVNNPPAAEQFQVGDEWYLSFSRAERHAAD